MYLFTHAHTHVYMHMVQCALMQDNIHTSSSHFYILVHILMYSQEKGFESSPLRCVWVFSFARQYLEFVHTSLYSGAEESPENILKSPWADSTRYMTVRYIFFFWRVCREHLEDISCDRHHRVYMGWLRLVGRLLKIIGLFCRISSLL